MAGHRGAGPGGGRGGIAYEWPVDRRAGVADLPAPVWSTVPAPDRRAYVVVSDARSGNPTVLRPRTAAVPAGRPPGVLPPPTPDPPEGVAPVTAKEAQQALRRSTDVRRVGPRRFLPLAVGLSLAVATIFAGLPASRADPRLGWAVAVLGALLTARAATAAGQPWTNAATQPQSKALVEGVALGDGSVLLPDGRVFAWDWPTIAWGSTYDAPAARAEPELAARSGVVRRVWGMPARGERVWCTAPAPRAIVGAVRQGFMGRVGLVVGKGAAWECADGRPDAVGTGTAVVQPARTVVAGARSAPGAGWGDGQRGVSEHEARGALGLAAARRTWARERAWPMAAWAAAIAALVPLARGWWLAAGGAAALVAGLHVLLARRTGRAQPGLSGAVELERVRIVGDPSFGRIRARRADGTLVTWAAQYPSGLTSRPVAYLHEGDEVWATGLVEGQPAHVVAPAKDGRTLHVVSPRGPVAPLPGRARGTGAGDGSGAGQRLDP